MNRKASTEELLTSAAVARLLDITPAAVRMAARTGRLRVAATASGIRLYTRRDVDEFDHGRAAARVRL